MLGEGTGSLSPETRTVGWQTHPVLCQLRGEGSEPSVGLPCTQAVSLGLDLQDLVLFLEQTQAVAATAFPLSWGRSRDLG